MAWQATRDTTPANATTSLRQPTSTVRLGFAREGKGKAYDTCHPIRTTTKRYVVNRFSEEASEESGSG
eukprot:4208653-Amphidinium_carterae.1